MSAAAMLQVGSIVLVNVCFSLIVGTVSARLWLRSSVDSAGHARVVQALHRTEVTAAGLGLIGAVLSMWAASAVMMGGTLGDAAAMLWTMAIQTAYGQAGLAGIGILAAVGALSVLWPKAPGFDAIVVVLLLGFAASRASVSHAGEDGMFTLNLAVEWIHLLLIALWFGGVAIGGWLVLPLANAKPKEPLPISRYLILLSHAATLALAGIFATGVYNAFQRVGTVHNLFGNEYGTALIVKIAFVGLAVALGGYNKVWGFPAMLRSSEARPRVIAVLRFESLLLLGALAAAAVLTTQQPPMAT